MKACTFRNRFVSTCLVFGAVALAGQQSFANFRDLEVEFIVAKNINSIPDLKIDRLATVDCKSFPKPDFDLPTPTENSSFSEEVKLLIDSDDFKYLIFELRDKNTKTIVEYTKCATKPVSGVGSDFGPYKRVADSLDEVEMTRNTGMFSKDFVYSAVRSLKDADTKLIFNIGPTAKRSFTLPETLNLMNQENLLNSMRGKLKELGAGGGNDREAYVDKLEIYTLIDGRKGLKATIRGITKQSGDIPGFEQRNVGFGISMHVPVMKWGTVYHLEDHIQDIDVLIAFEDGQWKLMEAVQDSVKVQGVPVLGLQVESKICFAQVFSEHVAPHLLTRMTAEEVIALK